MPDFYDGSVDNGRGPDSDHAIVRRARKIAWEFGRKASYTLIKEALIESYGEDTYRRYKRRCVTAMVECGVKIRLQYEGGDRLTGERAVTARRIRNHDAVMESAEAGTFAAANSMEITRAGKRVV